MTLEECKNAWEAAGKHGSREERIARNAKWLNYYCFLAGKENPELPEDDRKTSEILDVLKSEQILRPDCSVLDIGAGTGAFSLALAACCGSVTALEMEQASLELLGTRARKCGCSNVIPVNAMWENYQPQERFDVSFTSMCPAICNQEELLRMEAMTRETCCILAVARGSRDLHRQKLMREVFHVRSNGGMNTEAIWYYDMLYLMGRAPSVRSFTRVSRGRFPVEALVERNRIYLEIFGIAPEESEPLLRDYFAAVATDGMVEDETCIRNALIWWTVPQDGGQY